MLKVRLLVVYVNNQPLHIVFYITFSGKFANPRRPRHLEAVAIPAEAKILVGDERKEECSSGGSPVQSPKNGAAMWKPWKKRVELALVAGIAAAYLFLKLQLPQFFDG
jgi:hypothetical protein